MVAKNREEQQSSLIGKIWSVLFFLIVLYTFFFCIELMGYSFKLFGQDFAESLLKVTENPVVGLLLGILATSVMQSSSSTTSIVVGMVAAGTLTVENAVPIIMGANIGTTITNTIISLGHVQRKREFELAFAGAVVHDFFNICTVLLFLPLEYFFHPIQKTAEFISSRVINISGAEFESPLKMIVKPVVKEFHAIMSSIFEGCTECAVVGAGSGYPVGHGDLTVSHLMLAIILLVVALGLLIFALSRMVKIMRGAMAAKLEVVVDKYLFTGTFRGLFIGIFVTALVQSSSVTTSLVIPLLGAGIVRLEMVFPYMVGANIGTTVTAILASMVTGNPAAVTIAICHFVFNMFGTMIFVPLRKIPIAMAKALGKATAERRWFALLYIVVVFFIIPAIIIFVM